MTDSAREWKKLSADYFKRLEGLRMRDPARIDTIIDELRAYWHRHPDMRLGQIIANATPERFHKKITLTGRELTFIDPFYAEDDEMLDGLRNLP